MNDDNKIFYEEMFNKYSKLNKNIYQISNNHMPIQVIVNSTFQKNKKKLSNPLLDKKLFKSTKKLSPKNALLQLNRDGNFKTSNLLNNRNNKITSDFYNITETSPISKEITSKSYKLNSAIKQKNRSTNALIANTSTFHKKKFDSDKSIQSRSNISKSRDSLNILNKKIEFNFQIPKRDSSKQVKFLESVKIIKGVQDITGTQNSKRRSTESLYKQKNIGTIIEDDKEKDPQTIVPNKKGIDISKIEKGASSKFCSSIGEINEDKKESVNEEKENENDSVSSNPMKVKKDSSFDSENSSSEIINRYSIKKNDNEIEKTSSNRSLDTKKIKNELLILDELCVKAKEEEMKNVSNFKLQKLRESTLKNFASDKVYKLVLLNDEEENKQSSNKEAIMKKINYITLNENRKLDFMQPKDEKEIISFNEESQMVRFKNSFGSITNNIKLIPKDNSIVMSSKIEKSNKLGLGKVKEKKKLFGCIPLCY